MPKRVSKSRSTKAVYWSKSYRSLVAALQYQYAAISFADSIYVQANRLGFMRRMLNLQQGKPISGPPTPATAPRPPLILPAYDPHKKYAFPTGLTPVPNELHSSILARRISK